jgi:hypothetical protein|eukprot:COSAG06_NODE_1090_length_10746_cov_5.415892_13_plen_89_part_00
MAAAFPNISYVNFNHDEIRGMARDSRSLRSGLSNAQLLAKDMNALQASVHKHLGKTGRAMYWDGECDNRRLLRTAELRTAGLHGVSCD